MSRKGQKTRAPAGHDSHHILHYRRLWDKGHRQLLRRAFVYDLPLAVHQQLHAEVGPVPPLDEADAKWLWCRYVDERRSMDLFEALAWLRTNAPNSEFAVAIMAQEAFLSEKLERS